MNLEISSFADGGTFAKERLILKARADLDLGKYAVFCTALTVEKVATSGKKLAYWFPDEEIKANDLVVLYTKRGTASKKEIETGRTAHFFYWGEDHALWGGAGNGAVVLQVSRWAKKVPGE
jgi:hypothetical protein